MLGLAVVLPALAVAVADAQTRKPTAQEVAAIRNCAAKYQDDVNEGERQCLFNLVATPCSNTREGSSNLGTADCYRVEWVIWDNLLNGNFKNLMGALDNQQTAKLRAMQQAWIAYRATPPAISTWTRFKARWQFRWERLVRRAKPPAGRCCFGSSNKSKGADCATRRSSTEPPVIFQHRIEQDLRACGALLKARPLRFIVRNAAAARHEDHRRRRHAGDIDRIVAGA